MRHLACFESSILFLSGPSVVFRGCRTILTSALLITLHRFDVTDHVDDLRRYAAERHTVLLHRITDPQL
jgi:hypothetical protein